MNTLLSEDKRNEKQIARKFKTEIFYKNYKKLIAISYFKIIILKLLIEITNFKNRYERNLHRDI